MENVLQKYETRPLDCWPKAKELRYNFFKEFTTAREQGKYISLGGTIWLDSIMAGIGEVVHLGGEIYGGTIGSDPDFAQTCNEAVEARGYSRDLCAWTRGYWGSVFLDRFYFGGPFPRPDFVFTRHGCDSHAKWFQTLAEHFKVPYFGIDLAMGRREDERESLRIDYLVAQMQEAIAWLEKITGKRYDDERLIKSMEIEWEAGRTWAEVCSLNKAIPAPLDLKSIYSLFVITAQARNRPETLEFNRALGDEVKYRIEKGIAALATERCRLITDVPPPFYFLELYHYAARWGAVFIGSEYTYFLAGAWTEQEDGSWGAAKSLKDLGISLRTREDALRLLAKWADEHWHGACFYLPEMRTELMARLAREWHANGAILHLNRGCEGMSTFQMEQRLGLTELGIPVSYFESNFADKREFDERQVLDRVDSYLESLGLNRLVVA